MKNNNKKIFNNAILTCMTALCFMACSMGIAVADDPCSEKGMSSVPGQMASQVYAALYLTNAQEREIGIISRQVKQEFEAWGAEQRERRDTLLDIMDDALEDGVIEREEKNALKDAAYHLKSGRIELFKILARGVSNINNLLTEEQQDTLETIQITVELPDAVTSELAAFRSILEDAVAEYKEDGTVSDSLGNAVKDAWQSLLQEVFLPDIIRNSMDGRVISAMLNKLNARESHLAGYGFNLNPDNLITAISDLLQDADIGAIEIQEILADMEDINEVTDRISTMYNFAKTSFMEAFMMTPIFNCQMQ